MSEINNIQVSGRLKNVRTFNGTMVVAQLSQRVMGDDDRMVTKFSIPVVTFDPKLVSLLGSLGEHANSEGITDEVVLSGHLKTRFSRNADGSWATPLTQIVVKTVDVA